MMTELVSRRRIAFFILEVFDIDLKLPKMYLSLIMIGTDGQVLVVYHRIKLRFCSNIIQYR